MSDSNFRSLCEMCFYMREVVTPRGSRFLLCQLSASDLKQNKYPPQPILRCDQFQMRLDTSASSTNLS